MGKPTVADVLKVEPGPQRDQELMRWCGSVWAAWSVEHGRVRQMMERFL
jgi:hypothetical protein